MYFLSPIVHDKSYKPTNVSTNEYTFQTENKNTKKTKTFGVKTVYKNWTTSVININRKISLKEHGYKHENGDTYNRHQQ